MAGTGTGLPPDRGGALAQAPGVIDVEHGAGAAWSRIASHGARLAKSGFDALEREAAQRQAAYLADQEVAAQRRFAEVATRNRDDPAGFDAEWNGVSEGVLGEAQPWAIPHLKKLYGGYGARGYGSALETKRRKDEASARDALDARLTMADNDLMGLAMAGKVGAPEWQGAKQAYDGVIDTKVGLGLMTPDEAKLKRDDLAGRVEAETATVAVRGIHEAKGFEAAIDYARRTILENDRLPLSPAARYRAFNRAVSDARLLEAERRQERQEVVQRSRDLRERIKADPNGVGPGEVRGMVGALTRTGAIGEASRLAAEYGVAEATAPFRSGSMKLSDFAQTIATMRGGGKPGAAGLLRRFEGFREEPYWDKNAFRVGFGSDTITRADGAILRVRPGMRVTREDAERDLTRRLGEFQAGIVRDVGQEAWGRLPANARDALTSVAYNYGRLPTSVAMAVSTGGSSEDIAKAIEGLQGHNDGINRDRRLQEAALVRGAPLPAGGAGRPDVPSLGRVTREAQRLFVDQAKGMWPRFKAMMERGETPDLKDFEAVAYAASISDDPKWAEDVNALSGAFAAAEEMQGIPQTEARGFIDTKRAEFGAGGFTVEEDTVLKYLEAQYERQQKLVTEAPVEFAIQSNPRKPAPAPLDLSSPDAARAGIAERVSLARGVAAAQEVPAGTPLRESDRKQIAHALQGSDARPVAVAMDALAQIPREMLRPALSGVKDALAGAVNTTDPVKYQAVMSGLDVLSRRDPQAFADVFGPKMIARLEGWQSVIAHQTPEQQAKMLQRRLDGSQAKVVEEWQAAAERFARADRNGVPLRGARQLADEMAGYSQGDIAPAGFASAAAFEADYRAMIREQAVETHGDVEAAHRAALKALETVWKVSPANGGRLTKHPPEQFYPTVGQSHDWIGAQLQADLRARVGGGAGSSEAAAFGIEGTPFEASGLPPAPIRYALVATPETQADIAAGRPPRYRVIYTNPHTGKIEDALWQGDPRRAAQPLVDAARRERTERDAADAAEREHFQRVQDQVNRMGAP